MQQKADKVPKSHAVGERSVPTLMGNDPQTGAYSTLGVPIQGPENKLRPERNHRVLNEGTQVVEEASNSKINKGIAQ
jgi:hypothetical protein